MQLTPWTLRHGVSHFAGPATKTELMVRLRKETT